MNQNTSVDNDLQKAIDDITKTTNGDPLFSDPVATPATPAPTEPFPSVTPTAPKPISRPAPRPAPMPAPAPMPEPVKPAEPVSAPEEIINPTPIESDNEPKTPFVENGNHDLDIDQVKEAALRELAPILDKIDVPAEQKFDIYKDVISNYHDSSVIEPAYRAASEIKDERERAEALLYIISSIDKM
ncbi:MAG: hypothetical protein Q4A36_01380 [Candidatus Saccharibacteria bacterium]|nr:hypothetical protein [Candidatus Saccharibacteria bacterium]